MAEKDHKVISIANARSLGLKRYFTGSPCPHGHISERYVSSRLCVVCCAKRKTEWANKNQDKVISYNKKWLKDNYDSVIRRNREWRLSNPERNRANKARDYLKHKKKYLEIHRRYRETHKEQIRNAKKLNVAANPEKYSAYKRNRKARKRNAAGSHRAEDIIGILRSQNGKCAYCKTKLGKSYHVDHIIPLISGGTNWPNNLQILCRRCNQTKSAKDPIDFMQERGFLL